METPILKDQNIPPTRDVLANALGDSYPAYEELMGVITGADYGLVPEWNYYKDGNAWLCKVCFKKKTVFWLSVWDKYFRTGFYFSEKYRSGVMELDIGDDLKENFSQAKPIGMLIPLAISVNGKEQLQDVLKTIVYKRSLK